MTHDEILKYLYPNTPHECGHMTVLFKANRLTGLTFFPHEMGKDGRAGIFEASCGEVRKEDCVALAAGMVGELVLTGAYSNLRCDTDRKQLLAFSKEPLENFAHEAYEIISANLLFFMMLNKAVGKEMYLTLENAFAPGAGRQPDSVTVFSLAQTNEVYKEAESALSRFTKRQ